MMKQEKKELPILLGGGASSFELIPSQLSFIGIQLANIADSLNGLKHGEPDRQRRESIYYMRHALNQYFAKKYPGNEDMIGEICETVGQLLQEERPQGAGGVGMISSWLDQIAEIEMSQQ